MMQSRGMGRAYLSKGTMPARNKKILERLKKVQG